MSFVFFFKQKTAYEMRISDWSSDVCSSDLGASAAAVAILQLLERGIETSDAVEKKLGVMSLGSIPDTASLPEFDKEEAALPPTQMVVDRPQSSFAEAFRRLRTSIHFARPDQQSTIIAVTSSLPGEGDRKSTRLNSSH